MRLGKLAGTVAIVAAALGAAAPAHAFRDIGLCRNVVDLLDPDRDDLFTTPQRAAAIAALDACAESGEVVQATRTFVWAMLDADTGMTEGRKGLTAYPASALNLFAFAQAQERALAAQGSGADYTKLLDAAERAIAARPGWAPPIRLKAFALKKLGRRDAAIAAYKQALEIYPLSVASHAALAQMLNGGGDHAQALTYADRAAKLAPDFYLAQEARGDALAKLERFAEARDAYLVAVKGNPGSADIQWNLGQMLLKTEGSADAILRHLEKAVALEPLGTARRRDLAMLYLSNGMAADAVPHFDKLVKALPTDAVLRINRMAANYFLGTQSSLAALHSDAVWFEGRKNDEFYPLSKGVEALSREDGAAALEGLDDYIRAGKPTDIIWAMRGIAAFKAGQSRNANFSFEKAGLAADWNITRYYWASALIDMGELKMALNYIDQLRTNLPDNLDIFWLRLSVLLKQKQGDAALADITRAIAAKPSAEHFSFRALVHENLGDYPAAVADWRRTLDKLSETGGDRGYSLSRLGFSLGQTGDHVGAADAYRKAVALSPDDPDMLNGLCWHLTLAGRGADAVPHCEKALSIAPTDANIMHSLARALEVSGDRAGAVAQYRRALMLNPELKAATDDLKRLGETP